VVSLDGGAAIPLGPDGVVRTHRFAREGDATPARVSEMRPVAPAAASAATAGTQPTAMPAATLSDAIAAPARTEPPAPAATTPELTAAAEREILERHQRWFDAFERGDRATMASLAADNFSLVDQRPERAPAASGRVERIIQDLRVQVTAGIGAVLSGRISETTTDASTATIAMLSEVWIRRGDEWRLVSVRMVPVNAVPAALP
jgi:hypothetical protein